MQIEIASTRVLKSYASLLRKHLSFTLSYFSTTLRFPKEPMDKLKITFTPDICSSKYTTYFEYKTNSSLDHPATGHILICSATFERWKPNKWLQLNHIANEVGKMLLNQLTIKCPIDAKWLIDGLASWVTYFQVYKVNLEPNYLMNMKKMSSDLTQVKKNEYASGYFIQWIVETQQQLSPAKMLDVLYKNECPYGELQKELENLWKRMIERANEIVVKI